MANLVGKHLGGRPTIKTPEIVAKICEAISYGLTNKQAAAYAGIALTTLDNWREDPEVEDEIEIAVAKRMLGRIKRVEEGAAGWQGTAWILERLHVDRWSEPKVQVLLRQPQLVTNNNNTVVMSLQDKMQRYLELKGANGNPGEIPASPR